MSSDNNLLSFLKKQSLFEGSSPNKAFSRRSRSKSRDRSSQAKGINVRLQETNNYQEDVYNQRRFANNTQPSEINYIPTTLSQPSYNNNNGYQTNGNLVLKQSKIHSFDDQQKRDNKNFPTKLQYNNFRNNEMWTGLVSHQNIFESARQETTSCLNNLSIRIKNQVNNLTYKIDSFNSKMHSVINGEFKNLREKIYAIVEQSYKQSERYIKEYMKAQEDKMALELIKMRDLLKIELDKVEKMKEEVDKSNWRKATGEIIASDFEHHVEQLLAKSSRLQAGKWQLGDIIGYRLKDIERNLKQTIKLRKQT